MVDLDGFVVFCCVFKVLVTKCVIQVCGTKCVLQNACAKVGNEEKSQKDRVLTASKTTIWMLTSWHKTLVPVLGS